MNCPYCDNPVPPNVSQCPSCGAQVRQEYQQQYPPQYQYPPQQPQQPPPQYQYPPQQPYPQQYPPQYQYPPQQPQPLPPQFQQQYQVPMSDKSRAAYVLLGLVSGVFGIHNFYIGRVVSGVFQVLLSILFVAATRELASVIMTGFWVFFELLFVNKDGQGRLLR